MRFGTLAGVAAFAFVVMARPVVAQPSSKADALFNEGRELLDAGKFKAACDKFEDSLREADALGTRMNLALCMEKRGKVHTAVVKFDDAAQRADRENQPDAALVAREHATALRPLIPKLTVKLTDPVPGQRAVITRPGAPEVEIGDAAVAIDPTDPADADDRVIIRASAPGYADFTSPPAQVAPRTTPTIVIPALTKLADTSEPVVPGPARSKRKLTAVILGAGGLVMIGGGTIWAKLVQRRVQKDCINGDGPCGYEGFDKTTMKRIAPGIIIGGAAAILVGAILYFTAPKSGESVNRTAVVPTISPDGAGLTVLGHF